jgi:hypothetical protein
VSELGNIAADEGVSIRIVGGKGASQALNAAKAQAKAELDILLKGGMSEEQAIEQVMAKYKLQFPQQIKISQGRDIDILIRKSGVETWDEFKELRLSPEGEARLRTALGMSKDVGIDYYNTYELWFTEEPWGVCISPNGSLVADWGPYGP